ncbi:hypothetical protein P0W64_16385 [Tsukamurella sp. 8F]|uniref:DUF6551 family protein n=1 Tax=unclassified Tsukamurella TaxID=2633480 RepID=UPI0023BA2FAC|nr:MULTISPECIES: DUF6551 family protein [unclassified Tsukamurella]MDF0531113.1 hypothetical protein [Tsukamurella sp. 8J]MDF0588359.1 hypothetical protein [Tsukamurella sp. 8F]
MTHSQAAQETVYITALPVSDMFVDHTYQRDLDERRARAMAAAWDPRLVGVVDVSDRGPTRRPRFALVNGQHRWAACTIARAATHLVANVHVGLSIADEARLFGAIDRTTRPLTTWARWKGRRAAGDPVVLGIDEIAGRYGLRVAQQRGYVLMCFATLEHCYTVDPTALALTLELITDVWHRNTDGLRSGIVRALFEIIRSDECDSGPLADALDEITPTDLHSTAVAASRDWRAGQHWMHCARVIIDAYNTVAPAGAAAHFTEILQQAAATPETDNRKDPST